MSFEFCHWDFYENNTQMVKQRSSKPDTILMGVIFMLLVFGLVMISSAGIVLSQTKFGDEYYFFKHQLAYGVVPGLLILFVTQKINYKFWKKLAVPFFFFALLLLVLVLIPGLGMRFQGASRWLSLGPISFQPSEAMKLAIILYLALWIESRGRRLKDFFEGFLPFAIIVGVIGFLIMKQPDMGTLGSIIMIAMVMFFASGAPLSFIALMAGGGAAMAVLLVKLEPYRMDRLTTFLDPGADPQGIGYQINQALLAIGSGGIFGLGLGHSRQKYNYLPEPIGDSVFAIVAEELGMVGAVFLLTLFVLFALRGYKIAQNAPDEFGRLVAIGITSWIIFQSIINIMAIVGLIPLTGIPLPFISYGSTSLVFVLAGVGILLNISKHSKVD